MSTAATAESPESAGSPTPTPTRALTPIQEQDTTDTESSQAKSSKAASPDPDAAVATINFHLDSDMGVVVQMPGGKTTYKVSSCSIANASPVWRAMLYGEDTRVQPDTDDVTIELDGDAQAIDVLFRIVHYDFAMVPTEPTLDQLFEISRVTSQYKCVSLTYPWANKWLSQLSNYHGAADCYANCHKVAWIAWEFGDAELFHHMVDALIASCKMGADGKLVNISGALLEQMALPAGMLDIVTSMRTETITKILAGVNAPLQQISSGQGETGVMYCKVRKDPRECEAMMLGSAIPALLRAHLYPVPDASAFTESILELKDKLHAIKTLPYVGRDWKPHTSHDHCNLGFRDTVDKCLKEMPRSLGDDYLLNLSKQAKLSGVDNHNYLDDYKLRASRKSISESKFKDSVSKDSPKTDGKAKSTASKDLSDTHESVSAADDASKVTIKEEPEDGDA
ncbi:Uu.00g120640.m01.CDS01 [Anthostomella pinea]|uniref:Uu.00g120640.m01.CDS01 n=1 Tax=Anthostomella pinea TaxID=933095 RepID=A0AAI8VGV1_9PEZI|nr:Uu.00g120640.m01.CDS01 [Anthostomella pinea]